MVKTSANCQLILEAQKFSAKSREPLKTQDKGIEIIIPDLGWILIQLVILNKALKENILKRSRAEKSVPRSSKSQSLF